MTFGALVLGALVLKALASGTPTPEVASRTIQTIRPPDEVVYLWNLLTAAADARRRGAYAEAVVTSQQAVELARRVHGVRHPSTISALYNLGEAYRSGGLLVDAEPLLRGALEGARAVLGPRHPGTLAAMNSLASVLREHGRHDDAETLVREAIEGLRRTRGPRDPDTLNTMIGQGLVYQGQGRLADAEALLRAALREARAPPEPRHTETLAAMSALAGLRRAQGRPGDAEALWTEALALARKAVESRRPGALPAALRFLAGLLNEQDRPGEAWPSLQGVPAREALALAREVLEGCREALALAHEARGALGPLRPRQHDTITAMSALAGLLMWQGRDGDAELLLRGALEDARGAFGPRDAHTSALMGSLADLHVSQRRLDEGEALLREALTSRRETLGPHHQDTRRSVDGLAGLLAWQGRHGDAEPLLRGALEGARGAFGPRHRATVAAMNNLAGLYKMQGRPDEAEALWKQALAIAREARGPRHSNTLAAMTGLAGLHQAQGRFGDAEALLREVLQGRRETLGPRHHDTLAAMNNLAHLHMSQGRFGDAEALLREALEGARELREGAGGAPWQFPFLTPYPVLTSLFASNLANLHRAQGRPGEAEPLLREALEAAQAAHGPAHLQTLASQMDRAWTLAELGRAADAVRQLGAMEMSNLARLGAELATTEAAGVRNRLVASQADYQDTALSLALLPGAGPEAAGLAASAVLRLKGVQAEEDAHLARLARSGRDPRARKIADELAGMRGRFAALFHDEARRGGGAGERRTELSVLTARMQEREVALARVSREYEGHLQVRGFDPDRLRAVLAGGARRAALLELRQYRPVSGLRLGGPEDSPRWAGVLVRADGARVVDLGPVAGTEADGRALLRDTEGPTGRRAARDLHDRLLGPFAAELAEVERLYVAPDGDLHLVPFAALLGPDGRRLAERLDLRLVQTGRDLLPRPGSDRSPARGLLALGGIDFDAGSAASADLDPGPATPGGLDVAEVRRRAEAALSRPFLALPASVAEVRTVADLYRRARPDEPVEVWEGAGAAEARLRARGSPPPRVLHLATHGFYRRADRPLDRPMLLSGVALAGANPALRGAARDGVLYAFEAQDLDLGGTELVVLSACRTGLGQVDYGEGVSGLVRALRTAGASHVLVALADVGDEGAADLMARFYRRWLGQRGRSDPAAAFRAAQLEAMAAPDKSPVRRDRAWAHFVLIGE